MADYSPIEQIAQAVADQCDDWRFMWNPDDHGRRARVVRDQSADVRLEITIHDNDGAYFVFAGAECCMPTGRWQPVSLSVRNPVTRKAIDYINAQLDVLEGA